MAAEHVARIGVRIRERREELGWTRRHLREEMNGTVTENDIYRWEKGRHRPGDDTLSDLARALQTDVSYFLVDAPKPGTGDLMGAFDSATDEARSQLDRIEAKVDRVLNLLEQYGLEQELAAGLDAPAEQTPKRGSVAA